MTRHIQHDPKAGQSEEPVVEEHNENPDEGKVGDVDDGGESAAAGTLEN